jgi:subtilisin family serine protease
MIRFFGVLLGLLLLSSCKTESELGSANLNTGLDGGAAGKQTGAAGLESLLENTPKQLLADRCYQFQIPFFQGKSGVFRALNLPSWASFDSVKIQISGCPSEPGTLNNLKFTVETSSLSSIGASQTQTVTSQPYTLQIVGDPLTPLAWHLRNLGQSSFAERMGRAGEDMKVFDVIKTGILGEGVRVAVSDTGLEIGHEDLSENILTDMSKNYFDNTTNPTPVAGAREGDHGTSVAGVIAAVGWNGKGSRGIAPKAKLAGLTFLHPN